MERYLYSELASLVQARLNCKQRIERSTYNTADGQTSTDVLAEKWLDRHEDRISSLIREYMPSGSGFDSGTKIDLDISHMDKLVFTTSFHHMNEFGMYDGWTEHTVTITPSFIGFNIRISGRNRNDIKGYIGEMFQNALMTVIVQEVAA